MFFVTKEDGAEDEIFNRKQSEEKIEVESHQQPLRGFR
jgi:hypothetical protein